MDSIPKPVVREEIDRVSAFCIYFTKEKTLNVAIL
jgi:hypothetical protein